VSIILFKSTHDVIKAKKVLDEEQISCEVLPVPKEISAECGMSLKVEESALERILELLQAAEVRYRDDLL
jgi:hypothetical protein